MAYDTTVDTICNDLEAEHESLDVIVAQITEEQWELTTPAEGWDVKDTIVHLVQADLAALAAVQDPEGFPALRDRIVGAAWGFDEVFGNKDGKTGQEILAWWRTSRSDMLSAFRARGPKDRIPWFGPDMSTLSFATARLMETWSHGADVADTLGQPWPATDRLRHVAHIGVSTRGWSYMNRGQTVPEGAVRVELAAPSGDTWTWGPDDADNIVRGDALDFCLLATQRRHRSQVSLEAVGSLADEWLDIAQAFAGPPTAPRAGR